MANWNTSLRLLPFSTPDFPTSEEVSEGDLLLKGVLC